MDYFNISPEEMAKMFNNAMPAINTSRWDTYRWDFPTYDWNEQDRRSYTTYKESEHPTVVPINIDPLIFKEILTLREKDITHIFLNPENAKTWLVGFPYPPCLSSGFIEIPIEERSYIPMDSIVLVRRDKSIKIIKVVSK